MLAITAQHFVFVSAVVHIYSKPASLITVRISIRMPGTSRLAPTLPSNQSSNLLSGHQNHNLSRHYYMTHTGIPLDTR